MRISNCRDALVAEDEVIGSQFGTVSVPWTRVKVTGA